MNRILCMVAGLTLAAMVAAAAEETGGPVVPKEKTVLFNGKDLAGWKMFIPDPKVDPATVWSAREGVLRCAGSPNGYIRTETEYADYKLHLEWRWAEGVGGNSGVLLHVGGPDAVWPGCIECQLRAGDAGDVMLLGGTGVGGRPTSAVTRIVKRADTSEKPLGEWNSYDITVRGNTIRVVVNGVVQNELGGTTVTSGRIGLQSEGKVIEFRNICLEPVE